MPSLLDNQKGFISTALVVILLIAGIFGGVYLATHQTILQPKAASTAETSVNLSTTASNLKAGDEFPVNVTVRSDQVAAKRVVANLSFPKDLLEVKNIGIGNTNPPSQTPYPASGLVSYWKFDEGQGTIIQDLSGNGNIGTLNGAIKPTWQTENQCISGKCLHFDGNSSYIGIGNPQSLQLIHALTLSAWVKPEGTASATAAPIIIKGNEVKDTQLSYALVYRSSKARCDISNGSADNSLYSNTNINDNKWHLITCVYIPSTSLTVYVDGKPDNQITANVLDSAYNINDNVRLGTDLQQRYYQGYIDEPRIYNYALTAEQIQSLYSNAQNPSATQPTTSPSPLLNSDYFISTWQSKSFDNNTGTITLDGSVSDPGYQTSTDHPNTIMATVTFRVKSTASSLATISFDNSSGIYGLTNNLLATIKRNLNVNLVSNTPSPTSSPNLKTYTWKGTNINVTTLCSTGDPTFNIQMSGDVVAGQSNGVWTTLTGNGRTIIVSYDTGNNLLPTHIAYNFNGQVSSIKAETPILLQTSAPNITYGYEIKAYGAPATGAGSMPTLSNQIGNVSFATDCR